MKIAVVTPSFNQGEFIERTIKSVLSQTGVSFDYMVIDGGSQDQTLSILKHYDMQLKWVSEPDRGQAHAVNKGIQHTESDLIGWLNSDDIYYPDALKTVCAFFAAHPEIDVVYGDANFIDREDQLIKPYPTAPWHLEKLKSGCYISQPATFFRRRVIQQSGELNEALHFCMDYEYWLRLGLQGVRFAYLPHLLAGTRVYPETKTCSGFAEATAEALLMLKNTLGTIPPAWIARKALSEVKSQYGAFNLHPYYISALCRQVWKATGCYQHGFSRIKLLTKIHYAVFMNLLKTITR